MKTLSVQQPGASLICSGIQDIENRSWNPQKAPGRILIHATRKKVPKNYDFVHFPDLEISVVSNTMAVKQAKTVTNTTLTPFYGLMALIRWANE